MNDLNQLVVWSTLLASVASLFTALITFVIVLEMRKQRLSQSAPKLVVAGELFYDVKVVRGKSGVPSPLYPTHPTQEKLQLHNVGSGDAVSIVANFKFIE